MGESGCQFFKSPSLRLNVILDSQTLVVLVGYTDVSKIVMRLLKRQSGHWRLCCSFVGVYDPETSNISRFNYEARITSSLATVVRLLEVCDL